MMPLLTTLIELPTSFTMILGHAGHGPVVDGGDGVSTLLHAMTSPEHIVPVLGALLAVGTAVWMIRRAVRNYRISKPT